MFTLEQKLILVTLAICGSLTIEELVKRITAQTNLVDDTQIKEDILFLIFMGNVHTFSNENGKFYRLRMAWE